MNTRREHAWELVDRYVAEHVEELPAADRERYRERPKHINSPLGLLVSFELARRRLSYSAASSHIAKEVPANLLDGRPPVAPSTLFYFNRPRRSNWRAEGYILE